MGFLAIQAISVPLIYYEGEILKTWLIQKQC